METKDQLVESVREWVKLDNEMKEINKELKEFYEQLPEDQKAAFNEELQSFLIKEMANIKSVYDGVKAGENEN